MKKTKKKNRQILKRIVDAVMTILLLFLMGYQFWGDLFHEWAGAGMFVLFILHHILNYGWYKNLFHGKYTPVRLFWTFINLLVLAAMLGMMISGIMLSRHVFAFLPINGGASFARIMHMLSAYWGFALMALHLGLHWNMVIKGMGRIFEGYLPAKVRKLVSMALGTGVAFYGLSVFIRRNLLDYMFLQTQFVFLDFEESKFMFFVDYLAMMELFIYIAHYGRILLLKTGRKTKTTCMIFGLILTAVLFTACSSPKQDNENENKATAALEEIPAEDQRILIAYFTRLDNTEGDTDTIIKGGGPYGELGTSLDDADIDALSSASINLNGEKASGNVETIAKMIQGSIGGDLFTIRTTRSYPVDYEELIDYGNKEKNENARPELAEQVTDLENYDVVFLGFPNWWYDMPMPVYSFLESNDFAGKTVIPFVSSAGSGFSDTISTIQELLPEASVVKSGLHIPMREVADAQADVDDWLAGLGF